MAIEAEKKRIYEKSKRTNGRYKIEGVVNIRSKWLWQCIPAHTHTHTHCAHLVTSVSFDSKAHAQVFSFVFWVSTVIRKSNDHFIWHWNHSEAIKMCVFHSITWICVITSTHRWHEQILIYIRFNFAFDFCVLLSLVVCKLTAARQSTDNRCHVSRCFWYFSFVCAYFRRRNKKKPPYAVGADDFFDYFFDGRFFFCFFVIVAEDFSVVFYCISFHFRMENFHSFIYWLRVDAHTNLNFAMNCLRSEIMRKRQNFFFIFLWVILVRVFNATT